MSDQPTVQQGLTVALRELAWTVHRRAPERGGVGPIPTTELALIKQVLETPGATVSELSQALGLRQSNTSAAIRTLVHRGFVTRETDPTDKRVTLVVPTELGRTEHQAIAEAWAGSLVSALEDLPDDQLAALAQAVPALQALERSIRASYRAGDRQPRPRDA